MKQAQQYLGSLLLGAAMLAPVAVNAAAGPAPTPAEVHIRFYDRDHRDYHNWDDHEDRAYRHWLMEERHERRYREYKRLNREQQREYWRWRHEHQDWH